MPLRALLLGLLGSCAGVAAAATPVERLKVPDGFRIEVFSDQVPNARSMAMGTKGTIFVGNRDGGKVFAVEHAGGKATKVHQIARGLRSPNGIAFKDGALYVAEISRITRYDDIENQLAKPPKPVVVKDDLPTDAHHGWKFIAFGPDGWLYVPVGAPCNICDPDEKYASIFRMKPDGSAMESYARGVRNTVGFDWNPADGSLWFTDNGRDMMGDDVPPCELNRAAKPGLHFGYPYCHGASVKDPEFGERRECSAIERPVVEFGAHTAPLGLRFYEGEMFPADYRGDVLVALHGSWNRSRKSGYEVLRVPVDGAKAGKPEAFVTGFLDGEKTLGRPVDVLELPDGSVLVSDDFAGAIYRVTYAAKTQ